MKKQIAITVLVAALLSLAGTVQAGHSNRGHDKDYRRGHVTAQHWGKQNRNYYGNNHHRYGKNYRGRHGYDRHRHKHHGHNGFRDGLRFAAGALILSSVVHAINNNQPRQVVYQSPTAGSYQDRWFRVDPDGQCVEVRLNQSGKEVWTYTDASQCY